MSPQEKTYDANHYIRAAAAGGFCCSLTHGALTPVDVVKTRIQLEPQKYRSGMIGGFRQVAAEGGARALLTGVGATSVGYAMQGWFKFGGVEIFKIKLAKSMGEQKAWDNRTGIYIGASAAAEFIADIFLCPLEACRIRAVSQPDYARGLPGVAARLMREEGPMKGFYSGFGPLLFKQVPKTFVMFLVQGRSAEMIYSQLGTGPEKMSALGNTSVSLASGVVGGVTAAIISHPADTLLSKVNKAGAGGEGSTTTRLLNIARETGAWKLCTVGLGPRCVLIGTLTALQFGIFDIAMNALGAEKFHFHNPADGATLQLKRVASQMRTKSVINVEGRMLD